MCVCLRLIRHQKNQLNRLSLLVIQFVVSWLILGLGANVSLAQESASDGKEEKKEFTKEEKQMLRAQKALWLAHILRDKNAEKPIQGLSFSAQKIPVFMIPKDESFKPLVKINMEYKVPGWKLFIGDKLPARKLDEQGKYVLYAYLRSRISAVELTAKGPRGEMQREIIYLFAPEAREFKLVSPFDSVLFTVGHSFLVYKQTTFGTFVGQSLLLGVRYSSPETGNLFGILGDFNMTVYTYDSSPIKQNPQFIEGRIGGTVSANFFSNPKYRNRFFLGVSTINFVSYGSPFGFSGLFGPDIGFRTEFYKSGKNSFAGEFHYTPYENGNYFSERSFKLNIDWNRNLENLRRSQFGLGYSNHMFSVGIEEIQVDLISVYYSISF